MNEIKTACTVQAESRVENIIGFLRLSNLLAHQSNQKIVGVDKDIRIIPWKNFYKEKRSSSRLNTRIKVLWHLVLQMVRCR